MTESISYHAFEAPPGDYVVSPFGIGAPVGLGGGLKVDPSALVTLHASAGEITYFGDFHFDGTGDEQSEIVVSYRRNAASLPEAGAVAGRLGLTGSPVLASTRTIDEMGGVFLCSP